jgi:hypothetical protein
MRGLELDSTLVTERFPTEETSLVTDQRGMAPSGLADGSRSNDHSVLAAGRGRAHEQLAGLLGREHARKKGGQ